MARTLLSEVVRLAELFSHSTHVRRICGAQRFHTRESGADRASVGSVSDEYADSASSSAARLCETVSSGHCIIAREYQEAEGSSM